MSHATVVKCGVRRRLEEDAWEPKRVKLDDSYVTLCSKCSRKRVHCTCIITTHKTVFVKTPTETLTCVIAPSSNDLNSLGAALRKRGYENFWFSNPGSELICMKNNMTIHLNLRGPGGAKGQPKKKYECDRCGALKQHCKCSSWVWNCQKCKTTATFNESQNLKNGCPHYWSQVENEQEVKEFNKSRKTELWPYTKGSKKALDDAHDFGDYNPIFKCVKCTKVFREEGEYRQHLVRHFEDDVDAMVTHSKTEQPKASTSKAPVAGTSRSAAVEATRRNNSVSAPPAEKPKPKTEVKKDDPKGKVKVENNTKAKPSIPKNPLPQQPPKRTEIPEQRTPSQGNSRINEQPMVAEQQAYLPPPKAPLNFYQNPPLNNLPAPPLNVLLKNPPVLMSFAERICPVRPNVPSTTFNAWKQFCQPRHFKRKDYVCQEGKSYLVGNAAIQYNNSCTSSQWQSRTPFLMESCKCHLKPLPYKKHTVHKTVEPFPSFPLDEDLAIYADPIYLRIRQKYTFTRKDGSSFIMEHCPEMKLYYYNISLMPRTPHNKTLVPGDISVYPNLRASKFKADCIEAFVEYDNKGLFSRIFSNRPKLKGEVNGNLIKAFPSDFTDVKIKIIKQLPNTMIDTRPNYSKINKLKYNATYWLFEITVYQVKTNAGTFKFEQLTHDPKRNCFISFLFGKGITDIDFVRNTERFVFSPEIIHHHANTISHLNIDVTELKAASTTLLSSVSSINYTPVYNVNGEDHHVLLGTQIMALASNLLSRKKSDNTDFL